MANALQRRYVKTGGYRTHYFEGGEGARVIVGLHGGGAGSSGSASIAPLMPYLGDQFRLLAPDGVGGYGYTDCDAPAGYGLQSRVEQIELFADTLCLDRFTLIGNSHGAWMAIRYALLHPHRVQSLVLIGSATIGKAMGMPIPQTPALSALFQYDYTLEGMARLLEGIVYDQAKITPELVQDRYLSSIRPGAKAALDAFFRDNRVFESDPVQALRFSFSNTLPELTRVIPTAFIWGEEDAMAPPSMGRQLEAMLPAAAFHFVPGAGHQVQTDKPDVVAEITRQMAAAA